MKHNNRVHPTPDSTVIFFERQWSARLTLIDVPASRDIAPDE
jgi:hypothetical protein